MKTRFLYLFLLIVVPFSVMGQILPSNNIVCQNDVVTYSSATTYDTYAWTVSGGTPSSGTGSTINVTWGTGNRGQITIEGFNSGVSQGIITQKIYIDQIATFTASPDSGICSGQSKTIGLDFTNKSLKLNGTTDYVGISNSNLINLGITDYRTVSMWFKANDVTTRQVLYNEGGATNGFSMYVEGGKVYCLAWEGGSGGVWNAPNATISTGQWYNITFVFDKDKTDGYHFKGYLDGVDIGHFDEGSKADNGLAGHSGPVAIGSNSNIRFLDNSTSANNYFNGYVDGFKLWNRSLTQAEIVIEKNHWLTSPVIDADLDVYINFDNSVLDIADSPSAESGALFGSPTYDDDAPLLPNILWSPGGATTSSITVSPTSNTSYSYTLTEKLSGTCTQNGSILLTVTSTIPTVTSTTAGSRVDTGTVVLGATASAGTINWYADATGGTAIGTGTSFTTPSISSTTTYYAEASINGCTSTARTAVIASVSCTAGATNSSTYESIIQVEMGAINNSSGLSAGGYVDYTNIATTVDIGSSSAIVVTNGITDPTSQVGIWVDWNQNGDFTDSGEFFATTLSADKFSSTIIPPSGASLGATRMRIRIRYTGSLDPCGITTWGEVEDYTINVAPLITAVTSNSRCGAGTVVLGATPTAGGTVNWYSAATGGSSLGSGNSFTTASLSSTTSFWVDATYNGFTTSARTEVLATIDAVPSITGNTPASRCGTGTVDLGATASTGTINWYSAATGGTSLGTGTTFTTPSISSTTTYYVDATDSGTGCTTETRTAVTATINPIPTITATTPASRCGTGSLTLAATASAGTINWYSVISGGASLGTGSSFSTGSISSTTTYYVDATSAGCTTASRTAVTATVNAVPTITSTAPASRCGAGTITLGATPSAGTVNWYSASVGGSLLGTGTSFTTPSLSATTTYYVSASNSGCTTATRTAVIATIYAIPSITSITPGTICNSGTVTLLASASAGTINWYATSTGGTSLATGSSFTTPSLSSTTTYYVDATNNGCTTASRSAVSATVTTIPTITGTTTDSRCGTGTLTLGATSSAGTIYWYTAATGGTLLGTGISFTTPSISVTTTYYAIAILNGCSTGTRTAVTATINAAPTITGTTPGSVCTSGTVNLGATASAGTISWYADLTGGVALGTGTSFTTPSISTTTSYYVEANDTGCVSSARTEVIATVSPVPTITATYPAALCGPGPVTLKATASAGTINWYSALTGGTLLGTGTTYTTPSITTTTTYYVSTTDNGCTTASRTAVVATISSGSVQVFASQGTSSGCYSNVKGAFDAINAGTFNGDISIQLSASVTETATAALNGSGTGSANYSSVVLFPTASGITITGGLAAAILNLNGADNVTIDGRVNQTGATKSLTIVNTLATGSVVQFVGDASANTIKYCTIQGVTSSISSGLIVFTTGTATGNDNNSITNCDIGNGATTPTNAIYSSGSSVVADNSNITISNNNIYNYFSATTNSNGILISSNSSAWTISNNKFYQTATRISTTTTIIHRAINIIAASGVGFDISSNVIGFANATGTGFTTYDANSAIDCRFLGIEIRVSEASASNIQGNEISNINLISKLTGTAITAAPGIFSGISVLAGNVNVGTTTGNTVGATTGNAAINITASVTSNYVGGIYALSVANVNIENNKVGAFSMGGTATIGFSFNGINTAGTGGNFAIANNTIGSTATSNSIAVGINGTTTTLSTFNGINNAATGSISIANNTIQNTSVYGTGASVFYGIINTGGTSTVDITGNNLIAGTNTGTGVFIGIANTSTAIASTLNINNNIIRNLSKTAATGTFTGISNAAAINFAININNNQLGNVDGGLINYSIANSAAFTGIVNSLGAASATLTIQNNDLRGVVFSAASTSVCIFISTPATSTTLSQNIIGNTFTNLNINTSTAVTFISILNNLYASSIQTVNSNAIVGSFTKSAANGNVIFCTTTGTTSQLGSTVLHSFNNFSNVTVNGTSTITGWANTNGSLDKTISNNTFSNWTGGSAAITVMSITGGSSTITDNTISNITTGTAAAASIIAITSGAVANMTITNNSISNLASGNAAFLSSFTGITNNAGADVTITGNTITDCTAGGTAASIFTGITAVTAGTGTLTITDNNILSGTNKGTGAFNSILNSFAYSTVNISNNIIRNHTVATGTFTGISNTAAVTNEININNNQLGNASGGLVNYSVTSAATLLGINNSGGASNCDLTIQGNDIRGITYTVASTNANTYIINSAATLSQNISNNTFTNLSVNTSGTIIFISNSIIMPSDGVQNINYNSISGTFTRIASSGALTLFTSTAANSNNNLTINNIGNNFSNITVNGTASIAGWINTDSGDGLASKNIDGNIFNNWSAGTTGSGTITALTVNSNSTDSSVQNNIISNITSAGTITGISTPTAAAPGNDNIFSNTIFNLKSENTVTPTTTVVSGINVVVGTTKNVYSNTIYNITGNNITTGSVRGIFISGSTTANAYQNTIYGISGNAITTGSVSGIWLASVGTAINVYRNKIYDISSTSTGITVSVQGIFVSGATASQVVTIRNNLISDIRTPNMSLANAVRGINLISTGPNSNLNVYYNTVYLNASSTGANFGSAGIYHIAYTTATTAALDLRNNIIVNLSTPGASGTTVALYRSSGVTNMLGNYATTSNNNLFYAGVPSASRLIYSDGGTFSAQTLAAYKAASTIAGNVAPRDQASVTENPTFISTLGSNANFLHIDPTTPTQIESGAVNVTGGTIDYDGQIRQGNAAYAGASTTAPDIGADEGDFTRFDSAPPAITYELLTSTSCTTTQAISATIIDATGVNTTSGTRPRIYYKKSTNSNVLPATNTNTTDGWKYVEASNTVSPFIFNMDYSLISGGVATGQTIQYFVVAQDIVTPTPYVGVNNGTFTVAPATVNLTSAAFPIGGTINSFTILAGLSSTKTVCTTGCDYTSLTNASGLFSDINTKGLSSDLVVQINSSITETGANSLNQILYGCTSNYTLTIKPQSGLAVVLQGNVNIPLINLTGADNVIFDGINSGGSSLTIRNTNTGTAATAISFSTDATSNTITNCVIEGANSSASSGVIVFGTGTVNGNDGNIISNNTIQPPTGSTYPVNSIYSAGSSTLIDNSGITISGNLISDYFSATLASNGVFVASNSSAWTISGNKFFQTAARALTASVAQRAIQVLTASGSNYMISNNIIGYASASSTGLTSYTGSIANSFRGIELTVSTGSASNIQGNTIAGISYSATTNTALPGNFSGISVLAGTVNIGTTTGNTIGATTGTDSIAITSATSLGVITGIYARTTSSISIQNNSIGGISASSADATIGYSFHGIYTLGGGLFTVASNLIGSTTTANSITMGTDGFTTTPVSTLNGIVNTSTGSTSISNNTVQNVSIFGTGSTLFNGILNSGIANLITIDGNKIIGVNSTGTSSGSATNRTGWIRGVSNTAAVTTINITNNIIRNFAKKVATGEVFGIINTGGVLNTININNNQLGNADGGYIDYSVVASSATLYGIRNTGGAVSCALSIQNNDIQGINYVETGTGAHFYISNTAHTLSQNISGNTFTNLSINTTTANISFITISSALFSNGVQTISNNAIVGSFTKPIFGGTVYFCNATGTSQPGSVITHNSNNFSNVNLIGNTPIIGWLNSNTSLNKTISSNTFNNWTGGSALLTVMSITGGSSTISDNIISNMTTRTGLAASIIGISSGATATMTITNNTISNLVSGNAAFANSFTGITNNAGTDVTITGNTITGCTAGGTLSTTIFTGITTITAGSGTLTNTGNSIISGTNNGTGAFNAIVNAATYSTVNISSNIVRNNSLKTGTFTAITNSGNVTSAININNNQLGNSDGDLLTYSVASASTLLGISNTNGTANSDLSIQNNNIQGINYAVAGTNINTYINNTATTLTQNISGNTFTNLSVNTTGAINFIVNNIIMRANGIQNVNNNSIITGFTKVASSGIITLFSSTQSTINSNVVVNNNNNNFSNITINGTASIAGWVNTDAGLGNPTKTIDGNTFSNWNAGTGTAAINVLTVNITSTNNATKNNTISNITSAGSIAGILTGVGNDNIFSNTIYSLFSTGTTTAATTVKGIAVSIGGTTKNIYQNTIYNIQNNTTFAGLNVSGIEVAGSASINVYNNKIHTILSSSSSIGDGGVNGILVTSNVDDQIATIYNNKIGNIQASAANTVDAVRGISIVNTGLRSLSNVYFNSVYLNATSSGTVFGSTAVYHAASTVSTTGALNLRNNIIVNQSTAKSTGYTVAFRRSDGAAGNLNNYSSTSNNNLFYAGVPGVSNLIYHDGTSSSQSIILYKAGEYTAGIIAPRDQLSVSELPNFLSTDPTQSDFLKINNTTISYIESGGVNISGITTDFDGDIRAGNPGFLIQVNGSGTAPDIGADEFDGKAPNVIVADAHASANGAYANLAAAFIAINAYDQTAKNINVTFVGSFTESTSAVLNAGTWTTLKMYPTKAGITVTGTIDNLPMIDLNGADKVTIDGRINQTGSTKNLTISNNSTAAAATATIRLINSAETNTLKYATINGASTSTSSGVIAFGTSSSGNGNDNNIIEYCTISNAAGNRPVNALYSAGSSGSENNLITIRNNNFYDFLNRGLASNGIHLNAFTTDCTISTNSFYETSSFVPTAGSISYNAIRIDNTSGNNFAISNNFIGGTAASCGGTAWTVNALTTHDFRGIYLNVGTTTASSIQNNTIKNWSYSTAATNPWRGIEVNNGVTNIGTVTANIIGASTGTGSIILSSSVNAKSDAIYIGSPATNTISKNSIGSINLVGTSSASHSFSAIYKASVAGNTTITFNLIGSSSTANSIYSSSAASSASVGQDLIGIYAESSGTSTLTSNTIYNLNNEYTGSQISRTRGVYGTNGVVTLSKNSIYNLSSASLNTSVGSVVGVEMNGTTGTATVTESFIYNLSNTNASFSGAVSAIQINGSGSSNLVNRNFIRDLSVHSSTTNASIYGILISNGTSTFANNIISLGGNTQTTIYGIYSSGISGNDPSIYFNTVYIGGSLGSGITNKSYAFYEAAASGTRDIRNNLFTNSRTTTAGASLHYGIFLNYGSASNLTLDYNYYYAPEVGGVAGYYNSSDQSTIPVVSSMDSHSVIADPLFILAGGSIATDYKLRESVTGVGGVGISLDYSQTARGNPPNIGAWEFNANRWIGTIDTDFATAANWSANSVPSEEASIVFALVPLNHCVLDSNRTVGSIVNSQDTYNFVTNGYELTMVGGLYLTNDAKIDASSAGTKLIFQGVETQIIPDAAFVGNTVPYVTVNNAYGVSTEGSFSITDTLNLMSTNPSNLLGSMDTAANSITLGGDAVIIGDGDVTGIINRTSLTYSKNYTFNNKNTTMFFENNGNALPTSISVKMSIGTAPSWRPTSINRVFEIIQTGASSASPTEAVFTTGYLDSELNGNVESNLVYQTNLTSSGLYTELGRADYNTADNWVKLTNFDLSYFPASFGTMQLSFGASEVDTLTWNGSVNTLWSSTANWTPNGAPSDFVNIIIPNTASISNKPILPALSIIKTINMKSGATLNSITNAQLTVVGGDGAWNDEGSTFNSGTSTVIFKNAAAKFSGTTTFNNVTIDNDAVLYMQNGSHMKIYDVVNNNGLWSTTSGVVTTVEYNGGNQNIVVPNPATNQYSNLILSGTGVKTMPNVDLLINESFSVLDTASATSAAGMTILKDVTVDSAATWNTGPFVYDLKGDMTIDGTFTNPANSIFQLTGTSLQNISGTAAVSFENLTVNNVAHVNLATNTGVNGLLTLTEGQLIINSTTFSLGGTVSATNGKLNASAASSLSVYGTGDVTFANNLFTTAPSIDSFFLSRDGIVNLSNQNLSVSNVLDLTLGNLKLNNTTFTMSGNTLNSVGGSIDASSASDTVVFGNTSPINMASGTFNTNINNLTISGAGGITSQGDLAVNKILNLQAANPSATKGILDLFDGTNQKTLNMGVLATTVGIGDVTGIVSRTSFNASTDYTFGNQYTYVNFETGGTYPTELKVKIQIGTAPAWQTLTTPIKRIYDFVQTGGSGATASVTTHYLDSELNGNTESTLTHWTFGANGQTPDGANDWGSTSKNTTNNWVAINSLPISYFPTVFGNLESTLAGPSIFDLIWNGSISTVWGNLNNWTPTSVPSSTSKIVIPDASTTTYDPILASSVTVLNMSLQSGSILNAPASASLTLLGGTGAWKNQGGVFNPSTSTVTFNNANATIEGTTNFYNLVIPTTYSLSMLPSAYVGIAGTLTNNGTLNSLPLNGSTLDYNGDDQTVSLPNPSNNHYYNLILSGSGIKTLPSTAMQVYGNLGFAGSATTTVNFATQVDGNLNLSNTAQSTFNANAIVLGGMNIVDTSIAIVNANKTLTINGTISNTAGTTGLVLKSDASGTASLIHDTNSVPATVERYISGAAEDWHFLSSPVSNQTIAGSNFTPSGTYGNGTGYDLYVWDEPTPCWVYHKNDATGLPSDPSNPKWPEVHPLTNFVPGRGYLYSVQAANPTKEFAGNLNNGTISYPLTANTTDTLLKGFNLVGNPYPSSIDWKASSGWTRSNLLDSAGGYDMWIWNPTANNYGVFNSIGTVGTNSVTQNIPPMQGFFVRAATNANITMTNNIRVHTGASNWMKLSNKNNAASTIKVRIASDAGLGFDEVLLQYGYSANKSGAAKLFSTSAAAPSTYFNVENEELSVRYLTNTIENPIVPLTFKSGKDGDYTFTINMDTSSFDYVQLEDKKTNTVQDLLVNPTYQFKSLAKDDANRFALHFATLDTNAEELSALIYYNGKEVVVDLSNIPGKTEVKIFDVLGKLLLNKTVDGSSVQSFSVSDTSQMLLVVAKSETKIKKTKVIVN